MFVTRDMIDEMAGRYGTPDTASFEFAAGDREFNFIRSTQKNGRRHDATLYIAKDDQIVVIAKPFYPPGMYRAPSGGLNPGESFHDGIAREMAEETGTTIVLERFLLETSVRFTNSDGVIDWSSFVFQARYAGGDFHFTDTREICEVRLAALDEFATFGEIMRESDLGGLHYRAALHETVAPLLAL